MAFVKIPLHNQFIDQSGNPAAGYVLKAYKAGSTQPVSMYANYLGEGASTSFAVNSAGYTQTSSGAQIFPYVDDNLGRLKFILYPDQDTADSNDTSSTLILWDNIQPVPVASSTLSSIKVATGSSLTDIATIDDAQYSLVALSGQNAANDNGAAIFNLDKSSTGTTGTGQYLSTKSGIGRWINSGYTIHHINFLGIPGVVADSTTSMNSLFTLAANAAINLRVPLYVPMPVGVNNKYFFDSNIVVPARGLVLIGQRTSYQSDDEYNSTKSTPTTAGSTFLFGSSVTTCFQSVNIPNGDRVEVHNMQLEGNGLLATVGFDIESQSRLVNCIVEKCGVQYWVRKFSVEVYNCTSKRKVTGGVDLDLGVPTASGGINEANWCRIIDFFTNGTGGTDDVLVRFHGGAGSRIENLNTGEGRGIIKAGVSGNETGSLFIDYIYGENIQEAVSNGPCEIVHVNGGTGLDVFVNGGRFNNSGFAGTISASSDCVPFRVTKGNLKILNVKIESANWNYLASIESATQATVYFGGGIRSDVVQMLKVSDQAALINVSANETVRGEIRIDVAKHITDATAFTTIPYGLAIPIVNTNHRYVIKHVQMLNITAVNHSSTVHSFTIGTTSDPDQYMTSLSATSSSASSVVSTYDSGNTSISGSSNGTDGFAVLNAANTPFLTFSPGDATTGIVEIKYEVLYLQGS